MNVLYSSNVSVVQVLVSVPRKTGLQYLLLLLYPNTAEIWFGVPRGFLSHCFTSVFGGGMICFDGGIALFIMSKVAFGAVCGENSDDITG